MRDMVTADSDWGTLKLGLPVGWGTIDLFILSNLSKYYNWILNFWNPFYSSVSNYKVKKQLSEIVKNDNLSIFEKLWPYYYKFVKKKN